MLPPEPEQLGSLSSGVWKRPDPTSQRLPRWVTETTHNNQLVSNNGVKHGMSTISTTGCCWWITGKVSAQLTQKAGALVRAALRSPRPKPALPTLAKLCLATPSWASTNFGQTVWQNFRLLHLGKGRGPGEGWGPEGVGGPKFCALFPAKASHDTPRTPNVHI